MPNIKISAAADAGTLLSNDMLPLARSGDTNAYHATMAEISTFTTASVASGAYGNVGRNLLHNSMFNVQQRSGPWTANGSYTADRWKVFLSLDTVSYTLGLMTDANRSAIGDEAARYYLNNTFTGNAGAGAYNLIFQPIEGVRRLSSKVVTVSFWAQGSAALNLGVSLSQIFGTGGSPSTTVQVNGQLVALTTSWARYSLTFTLPTAAGKTLGTNGDDFTQLNFWFSSGTTNATIAGNPGVQSGAVNLWGVQLEIGSTATPLEKLDPRMDLANCQRFYQTITLNQRAYAASAGAHSGITISIQPMRATPTAVGLSGGSSANVSAAPFVPVTNALVNYDIVAAAAGDCYVSNVIYGLSADL